jgi:hypothetical protein
MPWIDLPAPYFEEIFVVFGLVEGDTVWYESPS